MTNIHYISCLFLIAAPDKPTNFRASRVGENFVELEWSAPAVDGGTPVTGYVVQMSPEKPGNWTTVTSLDSYDTSCRITKLDENMDYYFNICALNKIGASNKADTETSVTTKKGLR